MEQEIVRERESINPEWVETLLRIAKEAKKKRSRSKNGMSKQY